MLNKTEFKRIRIGIGRPQSRNRWIVSAYVTSSFSGGFTIYFYKKALDCISYKNL